MRGLVRRVKTEIEEPEGASDVLRPLIALPPCPASLPSMRGLVRRVKIEVEVLEGAAASFCKTVGESAWFVRGPAAAP